MARYKRLSKPKKKREQEQEEETREKGKEKENNNLQQVVIYIFILRRLFVHLEGSMALTLKSLGYYM